MGGGGSCRVTLSAAKISFISAPHRLRRSRSRETTLIECVCARVARGRLCFGAWSAASRCRASRHGRGSNLVSDILLKCLHFSLCVRDENMVGVRIG